MVPSSFKNKQMETEDIELQYQAFLEKEEGATIVISPISERFKDGMCVTAQDTKGKTLHLQLSGEVKERSGGKVRVWCYEYRLPTYGAYGAIIGNELTLITSSLCIMEDEVMEELRDIIADSIQVRVTAEQELYEEIKRAENYEKELSAPERIAFIKEQLEFVFPGRWELAKMGSSEYVPYDEAYNRVTIHFPNIIIENGKINHEITDLYVQIYLTEFYEFAGSGIYGIRGTSTYEEFSSGYSHSHLSPSYKGRWSSFCVGSDTPIQRTLSGLVVDRWHEDNFLSLLLQINGFVRWESLAGGPHIKITDIGSNGSSAHELPTLDVESVGFIKLYKSIIENLDSFGCKLNDIQNPSQFIIDTAEEELLEVINQASAQNLLVKEYPNGTFKTTADSNSSRPSESNLAEINYSLQQNGSEGKIVFKENTFNPICVVEQVLEDEVYELTLSPPILKSVFTKLNEDFNRYVFNLKKDN